MDPGQSARLVLPHQLFERHFDAADGTVFVFIEHDLMFRQYRFHSHKLVLHRASMVRFARRLRERGHEVVVLESDPDRSSRSQLAEFVRTHKPSHVSMFDVVDDWLERDLAAGLGDGGYTLRPDDVVETPNFLTDRAQIDNWFSHNASRMQDFYIWQRRRLSILVTDSGEPLGGKWSFDTDNRKKLPRGYTPPRVGLFAHHPVHQREGTFDLDALMELDDEPEVPDANEPDPDASRDVDEAIAWVSAAFPDAPGDPRLFAWTTSHNDAAGTCSSSLPNDWATSDHTRTPSRPSIHSLITACSRQP